MNHTLFLPHGWCMTWNPWLIGLNVVTDGLVALSYYSIPAALFFVARARRVTLSVQPILILFGLFIALCGGGHLLDIVAIWHPIYWVKGFWNLGTAVASVLTAIVLIPRTMDFLRMPETNQRLEREAEVLREQRTFLQTVLDSVGDGIVLVDSGGNELLRNRSAQELLQRDESALTWPRHREIDQDLRVSGKGLHIERSTKPVPGYGQLYVLSDVTGELEMARARIRLERMVLTMKQGFAVISLDSGQIVQTNHSFNRMHGADDREFLGRPAASIYCGTQEEKEAAFRIIQTECENAGFWDGETRHARMDETGFCCASRFNLYEEGGQRFLSCLHFDITEQKRIQEEASRVQLRLLESAKLESLGVLAGGVAHDFNNLLTGIMGNTSLALELVAEDSEARPLIQSAIDGSERAARLTNQLLAYSGKGKFIIERVQLSKLALDIAELVKLSVPRHVRLEIEKNPALPMVEADVAQVYQVIMNLVINAAEAVGEKQGSVTVRTGTRQLDGDAIKRGFPSNELVPGEYVWIAVTDTGCGMDQATVDQIFDPFFTTKLTGRGLGLAAVQGIVRAHRGALKVESVTNQGSVFTLYLPAAKLSPPGQLGTGAIPTTPADGGNILIVDDEAVVRAAAGAALRHAGYEITEARDGLEALRLFKTLQGRFGLILLDLTMPVMGGEETFQRLRQLDSTLPILLISGYSEHESIRRFASCKFSGFLQKPFSAKTLIEKVQNLARRHDGVVS